MSKSILDNLFGSRVRVKLLKLLYRQFPTVLAVPELAARIQEPVFIVRRELAVLCEMGLTERARSSREQYGLCEEFEFFSELRDLVLKPSPGETNQLVKRLGTLGRVKLAVAAGIFVSQPGDTTYEAPADLLIVADDVDRSKLSRFLKSLEAEVGAEIRLTLMEKDEFKYRYTMFDRFLRVLLEGPHRTIINKLDIVA